MEAGNAITDLWQIAGLVAFAALFACFASGVIYMAWCVGDEFDKTSDVLRRHEEWRREQQEPGAKK